MPADQANVSYYITHYQNRLLSVLCVEDKPVQASFSPKLSTGRDMTTSESGAGLSKADEGTPARPDNSAGSDRYARANKLSMFAVGTILVGRINRVVANIRAVFVDIAPGIQGFLPFQNICSPVYCSNDRKHSDMPVQGDSILVQVEKEAVKTKDLVLTTKLALSGRYIVLERMPDNIEHADSRIRLSRKVSPKQRTRMSDFLASQQLTEALSGAYSCIVRTNAFTLTELSPMLSELKQLHSAMERLLSYAPSRTLYSVLYTPPADYLLALRDTYALSFRRIVTDIPEVHAQLTDYFTDMGDTESLQKLSLFDNGKKCMSLLNFYRLEERIKEALSERVWLKSGGYLVIEPTESLTAIDVNTGKYTGKSNAEDTYWKINAEAAQMIALQLRLRNLSGMILVDFINMKERERNEQLLELLRSYTAEDPVHTSVIDMTPLGLVEITRKKINKSLKEQYHETAFYE